MEKQIKIALVSSLMVCVVGAVFKILHWPGANIMLLAGLPSLGISLGIKVATEGGLSSRIGGLGIFALCIGALFKILHWPYGQEILLFALGLGLVALILLAIKRDTD